MADKIKEQGRKDGMPSPKSSERVIETSVQRVKNQRATSIYSKFKQNGRQMSCWSSQEVDCDQHLLGPPPEHKLGPKACILVGRDFDNDDVRQEMFVQDPTSQFLHWKQDPQKVLIIKKINDLDVTEDAKQLARWLIEEKMMTVYVELDVLKEEQITEDADFVEVRKKLVVYDKDDCMINEIDLIVCLGGDGTLLHASSLFQESCPPIVSFHLGTLGFLMPFSFNKFKEVINQTLSESIGLTLRTRLKNQVIDEKDGESVILAEHLTLNEVVIDRGPAASLVNLDIKCNGQHLTTVVGDGLIVATATGSTAYSAATGASMVHPSVPCIILTPICPHSLSFRPIIVPAGIELKVKKSPQSRQPAWASFDGRNSIELTNSNFVRITTSVYPLACVSHQDHLQDWFDSLADCLHWNRRDSGTRT